MSCTKSGFNKPLGSHETASIITFVTNACSSGVAHHDNLHKILINISLLFFIVRWFKNSHKTESVLLFFIYLFFVLGVSHSSFRGFCCEELEA